MDIQFFSNQFESTPVLSSHRLPCIHSYSTLIHSFILLLSFHSSSRDLFISFFYHFISSMGFDNRYKECTFRPQANKRFPLWSVHPPNEKRAQMLSSSSCPIEISGLESSGMCWILCSTKSWVQAQVKPHNVHGFMTLSLLLKRRVEGVVNKAGPGLLG